MFRLEKKSNYFDFFFTVQNSQFFLSSKNFIVPISIDRSRHVTIFSKCTQKCYRIINKIKPQQASQLQQVTGMSTKVSIVLSPINGHFSPEKFWSNFHKKIFV